MEIPIVIFFVLILLGILSTVVGIANQARSSEVKGGIGESRVQRLAGRHLPPDTYHQFHDVTLPTSYGTTQIDHIIVSRFGIFVIETKNLKGWIFGGSNHPMWTQVLFHESYKFQNPIHQNYTHIRALKAMLNVTPRAIKSVIVFVGDSTFKTPMPNNVTQGSEYVSHIQSFREPVLTESELRQAVLKIERERLEQSRETDQRHVFNLISRPLPSLENRCPNCGHSMVLRTAKTGFRAGSRFWGCSKYPKCRGTLNVS